MPDTKEGRYDRLPQNVQAHEVMRAWRSYYKPGQPIPQNWVPSVGCGDEPLVVFLAVRIRDSEQRIDKLEEANDKVRQWVKAYPTKIFHEPTEEEWAKAAGVLKAAGLSLDAISASNRRYVITRVGEILEQVLKEAEK